MDTDNRVVIARCGAGGGRGHKGINGEGKIIKERKNKNKTLLVMQVTGASRGGAGAFSGAVGQNVTMCPLSVAWGSPDGPSACLPVTYSRGHSLPNPHLSADSRAR